MALHDLIKFASQQASREGQEFTWKETPGLIHLDHHFSPCRPPEPGTLCISGPILLHPSQSLVWTIRLGRRLQAGKIYILLPLPQNSSH